MIFILLLESSCQGMKQKSEKSILGVCAFFYLFSDDTSLGICIDLDILEHV